MNFIEPKKFCIIIFLFVMNVVAFCQESYNVYFYGVIIPVSQENQKNITQDLFAAQIRIIPGMTIIDKRNDGLQNLYTNIPDDKQNALTPEDLFNLIPDLTQYNEGDKSILLFSKIDKYEDEKWKCSFYSKNLFNGKIDFIQKDYESYYKVLAEAKNLIAEILSTSTDQTLVAGQAPLRKPQTTQSQEVSMSVEGVSGTWSGEQGITKIILLRSGRGFIIFKNGASMNINIAVEENAENKIVKIIQNGPFNASFYPDIPRQTILTFAKDATPIEWNFNISESGSLTGIKKTLLLDSNGKLINSTVQVEWTKVN